MSRYRKLGELISLIDKRNKELISEEVLGINIDKEFMPSVANTIGTDLTNYKLIYKNIFACNPMHVGRDERLPVALYQKEKQAIVSPAYFTFCVNDTKIILSQFLMLIFRKADFDRNCWFRTDGSVRGGITWADLCNIELPVPPIAEQQKIVNACNAITARIQLKQKINETLEKTAQCLLKRITKNSYTITKLKDFCTMQYGYTATAYFEPIGKKFIRISDISKSFINWNTVPYCEINKNAFEKYKIVPGDILVARVGAVGTTKMIYNYVPDSVFASFLVRIKAIDNSYTNFIGLSLTSKDFINYVKMNAGGSVQAQANPPLLGEYLLKVPRKQDITDFNAKTQIIFNKIALNEKEIIEMLDFKHNIINSFYIK